ncbi:MAG TPA: hypothetical protein VFD43_00065 [Planctomycetota bacterium]|nr:hypothetical protein [Planctomycetota bacterium]
MRVSDGGPAQADVEGVLARLDRMRRQRIWPNGLRYLWTDAFGVVLLLSLADATGDERRIAEAERLVAEVERVLGRPRGLRIGEEPDRDGQYFHYLAMWLFALQRLSESRPRYRERALALAREIHPRFVVPGVGVHWKMLEDLSGPYPGFGLGAIDPLHGLVVYRLLDAHGLGGEIAEMQALVAESWPTLHVTQDLGLGMLLWLAHFEPDEPWARTLRARALATLDRMWVDPPGYFCREPGARPVRFAFTNFGVAIGLQAAGAQAGRVEALLRYFDVYRSGDEYDTNAITHVMGCCARLPGRLL